MSNQTLDDYCLALRSELDIGGINATLALLSNRTKDFWKSPKGTFIRIEGLVVLAAIMLLFLAIFGSWRRKKRCLFIRYGVKGAFTLSSSLVTYLLGSMQSSEVKSSMYPIWAVTLYILIGCADSITAYSLDDNEQIYRQFYQLAMYNIYALLLILAVSSNWGYIPVAFLVLVAENKFAHRLSASRLASASWNLNKMVADYMYQEHTKSGPAYDPASMKGYHYLVDWPLSDSELVAGTLYATELKADSDQVIDIEKVWQCKHRSLSEELKYTCLSFSLFHLLRRRFFGFDLGEFSQPKTHDFVFNGLLSKNENGAISYNKVFKVIDVELAFMYDFFFTKYAVLYYGSKVIRFMSMASACLMPVIASLTLSGVIKIPSGVKGGVFLDTTEADVAITVAMLVCIALLEVLQLLHYRTTIWGRVSLACQCVREQALNKQRGCCMKFKEILTKVGMSASNDHYFEEKLGQYSLLESVIYYSYHNQSKYGLWISFWYKWTGDIDFEIFHPCGNIFRHWRVGQSRKSIRVPAEVKEAVLQSLERTDGKLTNGASSLEFNRAPHLLWACRHSEPIVSNTRKKENQTCFILTWHIATCYCEMAKPSVEGELKVYFDVSTALSKYCAHLVVSAPKLLPGHHYDTRRVFQAVVDEAFEFLGDKKDKYESMRTLPESGDMAGPKEKIFYKGMKLGKQLERMEGARWKVLADFWAEMLLYVAPSDNTTVGVAHPRWHPGQGSKRRYRHRKEWRKSTSIASKLRAFGRDGPARGKACADCGRSSRCMQCFK